jgi:hypothetical protein
LPPQFLSKSPPQSSPQSLPQSPPQSPSPFRFKRKNTSSKFKRKQKTTHSQFTLFIQLCTKHNLHFFQFYDSYNWIGPAIKVNETQFEPILTLFNNIPTITLNGMGFAIIRPASNSLNNNIIYPKKHFSQCKFTNTPIVPYHSESESESDNSDIESIHDTFIAEEWYYNGTKYLLDSHTNYLYFPTTLEFIGKKIDDFSIDFDAKEK